MTKRLARLALVGAAAAAFVLPASPASATHCGTFHPQCDALIPAVDACVPFGTFQICPLPAVNG